MSTFPRDSAFHQRVDEMLRKIESDLKRAKPDRKDTINVEKQDLEDWYRSLNDFVEFDHTNMESMFDLRDAIYAYLS